MRFRGEARTVRRGKEWLAYAGASGLVLALALGLLAPKLLVIALAALSMVAVMGFAGRYQVRPGPGRHVVEGDHRGLVVDGALVVPRGLVTRAHVAKVQDGHALHVDARGRAPSFSVVFEDAAQAEELLLALRLDASGTVAKFRALPPWAKNVRWLAVALTTSPWILINFVRLLPLWSWGLIAAGYGVIALPVLLPQRVEVGRDGVLLRWLSKRRFIPFGAIETALASELGVVLFLEGGKRLEIRLTQKVDGARDERSRLLSRIREGMVVQAEIIRAEEEVLFVRGERDLDAWLRDMRALGSGDAGGYRTIAIPRERLWEIVESPAADPSAREGAALALHAMLDEDERERLRALVDTTALPRLRVALDGVARETDEVRLRVALDLADREETEPPSGSMRAARAARLD